MKLCINMNQRLEESMATHSSIHAWRIPWKEEPGGLQSMGSQRVGHNWAPNTLLFTILQAFSNAYRKILTFPQVSGFSPSFTDEEIGTQVL